MSEEESWIYGLVGWSILLWSLYLNLNLKKQNEDEEKN